MCKVLSIDLDYIMGPTIELYQHEKYYENPTIRWERLFESTHFKENQFYIDQSNLMYCYSAFLRALTRNKKKPEVLFGYDHDSILYLIGNESNIELINIDHHDDVLHGSFIGEIGDREEDTEDLEKELHCLKKYHAVNEGNWGAWLHVHDKLKSFTWIYNKNSANLDRNFFNEKILGDKYSTSLKQDYEFEDYDFDYIFVCLSPQYVPPAHWHYFTMFMATYEEILSQKPSVVSDRKFEFYFNHLNVHNHVLNIANQSQRKS